MNRKALGITLVWLVGLVIGLRRQDALAAPWLALDDPLLSPAAGVTAAPVDSTVSITYEQDIDTAYVDEDTFPVYAMEFGYIAGAYSVNGGEILFTPAFPFWPGSLIEAVGTVDTLFVGGGAPAEPTVWRFRIATEESSGVLQNSGQLLGDTLSVDVALGDLDGDGDLDAFVGNNGPNYVWLNNGYGTFTDSGLRLGEIGVLYPEVELGDLDSDGDLDAFVVTFAEDSFGMIWWNDGEAEFDDMPPTTIDGIQGEAVALGDVDGDGDLDAVCVQDELAFVMFNDGFGVFSNPLDDLQLQEGTDAALGDLDVDGDLDLVITNNTGALGSEQVVFLNQGTGAFQLSQEFGGMPANSVSLGDLDGDGDLDAMLAITNPEGQIYAPNEIWWNDGSGTFTDSGQRLGFDSTNQVALGDMDGDGDLDAFFANLKLPNEVWMNNGSGVFSISRQFLEKAPMASVELADLERYDELDGDLDAFLTRFGEPDQVWRNLDQVFYSILPMIVKR